MIEFMVMVKRPSAEWEGLGQHQFRVAPRKGDLVTMDDENGKGQAYEVIAVIHPLEPAGTAGDLILRHIGADVEVRRRL